MIAPEEVAARVARDQVAGGGSTNDGIVLIVDLRDACVRDVGMLIHQSNGLSKEAAEQQVRRTLDFAATRSVEPLHAAWFYSDEADKLLTKRIATLGTDVAQLWSSLLTQTKGLGEVAYVYVAGRSSR